MATFTGVMIDIKKHPGVSAAVKWLAIIGLIAVAMPAQAALPAGGRQPEVPLPVQETQEELERMGCEAIPVERQDRLAAVKALKWRFVIASDVGEAVLMACPENKLAVTPVKEEEGRVAGVAHAQAPGGGQAGTLGSDFDALQQENLLPYTPEYNRANGIPDSGNWLAEFMAKLMIDMAKYVIALLFSLTTAIGGRLLQWVAWLIPALLGFNRFVSDPTVRIGWLMVLGITNLGFMLALVTIALLTALRLEVGGGVRRLLPRLFIGALLVNFSLVIAGLVLDVARIMTATVPKLMNAPPIDNLGESITNALQLDEFSLQLFVNLTEYQGLAHILQMMGTMVVLWLTILAVLVVAFGLAVRYVMLILLLIVSPLAYLFLAFPGMGGLAKMWWTNFLKYAFYGPVALFFIICGITFANNINLTGLFSEVGDPALQAMLVRLLIIVIMGFFFYTAGTVGKYVGLLGATAAVAIATKQGRRASSTYLRGARYAGRRTAEGAYALSGTRGLVRSGRAGIREATKPIRKFFGAGEFSQYDARGRLKPGESTRLSRLGERAGIGMSRDDRQAVTAVRQSNAAAGKAGYIARSDKNLSVANLSRGAAVPYMSADLIKNIKLTGSDDQRTALRGALGTTNRLDKSQLKAVIETKDKGMLRSVVNNVNIMSSTSGSQKSDILKAAVDLKDDSLVDLLFRTLDRAKRAQERSA